MEVHAPEEDLNFVVGKCLIDLLTWLATKKQHPMAIIETGTMRDTRRTGHADGQSTLAIAEWIDKSESPHEFYTIDIDVRASLETEKYLEERGLAHRVKRFGWGDATLLIEHSLDHMDFVYLDAGGSSLECVNQFMHAWKKISPPALIVIDDTLDPSNASKGLLAVPIAALANLPVASMLDRLVVIGFGVDLNELSDKLSPKAKFKMHVSIDPTKWGL